MTIRELIHHLSKFNDNLTIVVETPHHIYNIDHLERISHEQILTPLVSIVVQDIDDNGEEVLDTIG